VLLDSFDHVVKLPKSMNMPDVDLAATIQASIQSPVLAGKQFHRAKDLMVPANDFKMVVDAAGTSLLLCLPVGFLSWFIRWQSCCERRQGRLHHQRQEE
jgi:hypothetical protein